MPVGRTLWLNLIKSSEHHARGLNFISSPGGNAWKLCQKYNSILPPREFFGTNDFCGIAGDSVQNLWVREGSGFPLTLKKIIVHTQVVLTKGVNEANESAPRPFELSLSFASRPDKTTTKRRATIKLRHRGNARHIKQGKLLPSW